MRPALLRSPLLRLPPLVLLAACGPREPGPHPGELLLWAVTAYRLEQGPCSDREDLRTAFARTYVPLPTDGTAFLPLQVSSDGAEAELLRCSRLERSACQPVDPPLRFTVAGHELFHGSNGQAPLGTGGCALAVARAWVVVDQGLQMESTLTDSYSLLGPAAACTELEANLRATSPNGRGLEGCTVVQRLAGALN